ncbi:MAG: hypothetical protein A3I77_07135 [Gammaproteobacteria bacterium RIFCSPLOWO2_02_FULL_42_14]|nr:MAG: hypothetical protein A3B71_02970 [Gammaproteobacteria bacterium RIFCSPHIGHO2_02_FULL_42_43]OGT52027.1 MAG: hypothetical protein A3E54_04475 [Gammaproteobacteria bacterium RIFCSPHIGHO2_12_FULL_41_25]OGT61132.1 MAG: hypothetical protein A3I77_07135 [Gammaproteobacteria bacterium RIFCSPLOWO2_02_FULL_42_14]OGT87060.1 MAG: hypothetical protein A3G86_00855 [Gammaproteobacteria bacterium RIFCSPLOWO2_12_FULL_42_18]
MSSRQYKRNIESYALDLLNNFPILAILGARQVGKTWLSKSLAPNFHYFDLEKTSDFDHIMRDPELFLKQYPEHVILDEAQLAPDLFPLLRSVVDERREKKGRFIITGSSSPELIKNISESLAGRIVIIELGTLKANEYYQHPLSDFYQIFQQKLSKNKIQISTPLLNLKQIQHCWLMGGYPEPISQNKKFFQEWMIDYQTTYINRDIAKLFPRLDKIAYRRFITMLGKLSSKIINQSDLARSLGVSEPTIRHYFTIAQGTYLWRQLRSYENNVVKSIVKMPKGYIRDSGLLHHLLRIDSLESLQSDPDCGFSFEAFVIEEILKGIQDAGVRDCDAYYYRTRGGAEIDLILEGRFGLLPIEIKHGIQVNSQQFRSLNDFIKDHHCSFGVLINQSDKIIWLTKNIIQIPAGYL